MIGKSRRRRITTRTTRTCISPIGFIPFYRMYNKSKVESDSNRNSDQLSLLSSSSTTSSTTTTTCIFNFDDDNAVNFNFNDIYYHHHHQHYYYHYQHQHQHQHQHQQQHRIRRRNIFQWRAKFVPALAKRTTETKQRLEKENINYGNKLTQPQKPWINNKGDNFRKSVTATISVWYRS